MLRIPSPVAVARPLHYMATESDTVHLFTLIILFQFFYRRTSSYHYVVRPAAYNIIVILCYNTITVVTQVRTLQLSPLARSFFLRSIHFSVHTAQWDVSTRLPGKSRYYICIFGISLNFNVRGKGSVQNHFILPSSTVSFRSVCTNN